MVELADDRGSRQMEHWALWEPVAGFLMPVRGAGRASGNCRKAGAPAETWGRSFPGRRRSLNPAVQLELGADKAGEGHLGTSLDPKVGVWMLS